MPARGFTIAATSSVRTSPRLSTEADVWCSLTAGETQLCEIPTTNESFQEGLSKAARSVEQRCAQAFENGARAPRGHDRPHGRPLLAVCCMARLYAADYTLDPRHTGSSCHLSCRALWKLVVRTRNWLGLFYWISFAPSSCASGCLRSRKEKKKNKQNPNTMGNKNCCVGGEGSGKVVESGMGEQSGDGRYTMRGSYVPARPGGYPVYNLPFTGYPAARGDLLYQPRYPVILMDQYDGRFEYDNHAFEGLMDVEPRPRHKEAVHSRHNHGADAGKARHKGGKKTSTKFAENGGESLAQNKSSLDSSGVTVSAPKGPNSVSSPKSPAVASSASHTSEGAEAPRSYQSCDVIISFCRADINVVGKVKENLEAAGLSVRAVESSLSPGTHLDGETGEATIDAKVFVCLLNEEFLRSKTCRHQVALAYLSDSAIVPLNFKPRESLLALADPDLKLLLASYTWRSLSEGGAVDNDISMITDDIKALLDSLQVLPLGGDNGPVDENSSQQACAGRLEQSSEGEKHQLKKHSSIRLRQQNIAVEDDQCRQIKPEEFWTTRFGATDPVDWTRFKEEFLAEFQVPTTRLFPDEERRQKLLELVRRQLRVDEKEHVHKDHLTRFCCVDGEVVALWSRVEEKVREKFALKEVFCVESTVRVAAMRNVDKFCSPGVVDGLRDLLSDPEYSTRAAAAISLARVKADDLLTMSHIVRMLSDEDRLIREVGCLALGRLKSRLALKKLMYMWRNDAISNVREAACWALHQIGGQEVEDIFRVIKDLEHELRMLRDATT